MRALAETNRVNKIRSELGGSIALPRPDGYLLDREK